MDVLLTNPQAKRYPSSWRQVPAGAGNPYFNHSRDSLKQTDTHTHTHTQETQDPSTLMGPPLDRLWQNLF